MGRQVEGVCAEVLEKRRDEFNKKFIQAGRTHRHLDPEGFLEFLGGPLCQVVNQAADFEKADRLAGPLYELCLELFCKGLLGRDHGSAVNRAWQELFPAVFSFMEEDVETLPALLINSVYNISMEKQARENQWIDIMVRIAKVAKTRTELTESGMVAAWRCGMAVYRDGALEIVDRLGSRILSIIFGTLITDSQRTDTQENTVKTGFDSKEFVASLKGNRWFDPSMPPSKNLAITGFAGGFKGFGGSLIDPPRVQVDDGRIFVVDSHSTWQLYADAFGTNLRRSSIVPSKQKTPPGLAITIDRDGFVQKGEEQNLFRELANNSSTGCVRDSLFVCLPSSHYVFIIGQRG